MTAPRLGFVIAGAPRAGTTTLFEYLRGHPALALPPGKEAPFFAHDSFSAVGWERYAESLFGDRWEGKLVGKADPLYFAGGPARYRGPLAPEDDPDELAELDPAPERYIPRRIAAMFPAARVVVILRDPVARAVASHEIARLQEWDSASSTERLTALLEDRALAWARRRPTSANYHVVAGEYGRILGGYIEEFGADQVWVTTTRRLARDPGAVLRECLTFLGVDSAYTPANLGVVFNSGRARRRVEHLDPFALRRQLMSNPAAGAALRRLPAPQRDMLARTSRRVAHRVWLWNRVALDTPAGPNISDELRARLREHYAADRQRLAELVGEPLVQDL